MSTYMTRYTDISEGLQMGQQCQAEMLQRFKAQMAFAHQLRHLYPQKRDEWQRLIVEAGQIVQAGLRQPNTDVATLVSQGEAVLEPIGRIAKEYTLLCVSHAHIDMNWMWSWPETVAVTNDTFQTMLALMDEFPDFIFSQSQASTYRLIERYNPRMFAAIQQRVKEGRWEVTASQWVEGDKNLAAGESISRHLLYTRAYFQDRFGLAPEDVQVDFEPDTFGHPATLPTILAQGGVKYYYHCRGSAGPSLYWWIGPDGSRLLAFNDVVWYLATIGPQIVDPLVGFAQSTGMKAMLVLYGVGDHGGGPTRRDLRRLIEFNTWPVFPRVEFSSLHRFFRTAEATARNLPEVSGERNFVFTGCYTSQARQKWANRHGENLLYSAELAAVIGEQVAGVPYPRANLEEAWRDLLFEQFHDILPGSGVRETRHYAMGKAQEVQAAASMARTNALRPLSERVNTEALLSAFGDSSERATKDATEGGMTQGAGVGFGAGTGGESAYSVTQTSDRAFMVFNPLPYARTEVVEARLWDVELDPDLLVVTSEGMVPKPVQVLEKGNYWGHRFMTVAFPVEVPACGYRAVCVSDRRAELGLLPDEVVDLWTAKDQSQRRIPPRNYSLENEFIKVTLDPPSGSVVSLLDKRSGREWVADGARAGVLQFSVEENVGMTAWVVGPFMTSEDLLDGGKLRRIHSGPYVQTYRWTRAVSASTITLDITVRQGVPRVDFCLSVDWREMGSKEKGTPNLRVRFPLAVEDPAPRYEVPFGSVRRDLAGGEEVPALRWADLSEADGQGVTLVNSSKYGFSLEGTSLAMTLLRASIDPDPLPDLGEHTIEYALIPHTAGWTIGASTAAGEAINIPLAVTSCGFHSGDLPLAKSFARVEDQNVRLAAVKRGQDGASTVLRLFEVAGVETNARVTLAPDLAPDGATAVEVDTLERPRERNTARLDGQTLSVHLPAFGVATIRIA
ncbi:MAG: alpha-mannosidase [Anaerolineales bacterium]|nr:alpha-mannosidase [Anaerolineales bacterium]